MATNVRRASLDELMNVKGKAELIDGRIIRMSPTGFRPGRVGRRIARYLEDGPELAGMGFAIPDNVGYAVEHLGLASGRQSFSPDASLYTGEPPENEMRFIEGIPAFAAEVRGENDYSPSAEREQAEKRADFFAAGTSVVWDVDPVNEVIWAYTATDPENPREFRRGDVADAEPAVPGWRVAVDDLFR